MIRPNHRSVQRYAGRAFATAAVGGECNEHLDCQVDAGDRIVLRHSGVSADEETGKPYVDLSVAEWGCTKEQDPH